MAKTSAGILLWKRERDAVHQDLERAPVRCQPVVHGGDRGVVRHVQLERGRPRELGRQLLDARAQPLAGVGQAHARAGLVQ